MLFVLTLICSAGAWAQAEAATIATDSVALCFQEALFDTIAVDLPNPGNPGVAMALVSGPGALTYSVSDKLYGYYEYAPSGDTAFEIVYRVWYAPTDSADFRHRYIVWVDEPPTLGDQYNAFKVCWPGPHYLKVYAWDPESRPLAWEIVSGPGTIDSQGLITYTPDTAGVYVFEVAASDDCNRAAATVYDTVRFNGAPRIVLADSIFSLCAEGEICFDVVFSDPDGDAVWFNQVGGPGSTTVVNDSVGRTCFAPAPGDSAWYTFTYSYLDDCEGSDRAPVSPQWLVDSVRVLVVPNRPPQLVCPDPQEFSTCALDTFCFEVEALDPENGPLEFAVISGNAYLDETGKVCFAGEESDAFEIALTVTDECGLTDTCTVPVTVSGNRPPYVTMAADFAVALCAPETVCFAAAVDDPDFDIASVTASFGIWDEATDRLCFTADTAGVYVLVVTAADSCGIVAADTTVVTVSRPAPPTVSLGDDLAVSVCGTTEVCVEASVTADTVLSYILPMEHVFSFNAETGEICFTPDTAGVYTIVFGVVGECGFSDRDTTRVTVAFSSGPSVDLGDDRAVSLCGPGEVCVDVEASAGDLTILPPAASYDAETGRICFPADTAGLYRLIAQVTDSCGAAVDTVNISVDLGQPPVIAPLPDTTIYLCYSQWICLPLAVTDPDGDLDTVITNRGTVTNDGRVCFVPYTGGQYEIIITAIDECGNRDVDTAVVTIKTDENVNIITPRDTTVFTCSLVDTFCFPVAGVPEGAQVTVSGINTWWDAANQTVCFWSQCSNQNRVRLTVRTPCTTYQREFRVTVLCNSAPVVFLPGDTSLALCGTETFCLPAAISDVNRNIQSITVTGGVYNPRTSRICVDLAGPGTYTVTAVAVDSCGASDSDQMQITVLANRPPTVTVAAPDTALSQCQPQQVCLPVTIADPDGQPVTVVSLTGGFTYNAAASEICFTPGAEGTYCGALVIADQCNLQDTANFCVTITTGGSVDIDCPVGAPPAVVLCAPGEVCLPLEITGAGYSVWTNIGVWANNELCFTADTSGVYSVRVIASAKCNGDTCEFNVPVSVAEPVSILCPPDTTVILCAPDTICLPYSASASVESVQASGGAFIDNGTVCVPIPSGVGQKSITLIASGDCGADTCSFTITYETNRPPVIVLTSPPPVTTCATANVCVRYQVADLDSNIVSVVAGAGVVGPDSICFSNLAVGTYQVIATVTDACGATGKDTVTIRVLAGQSATIICPTSPPVDTICALDTVCVAAPVSPAGATVTVTPVGWYNAGTGQVCVPVSATGTINVRMIAAAPCGSDTCEFTVSIVRAEQVAVTAPATEDTLVCFSGPATICYPVTVTGTQVNVTVTSPAVYSAGRVCLPVSAPGTYPITLTAVGYCNTVSKTTNVIVRADQSPVLTVPGLQTFERCADDTSRICIDGIFATDAESTPVLSRTCGAGSFTLAGTDSGQVCFVPDTFGVYSFCFEATDGCHTVRDTMDVEVVEKPGCDVCVKIWLDGGDCTPVGVTKTMDIYIEALTPIGGFDLLLAFDKSVLTLTGLTRAASLQAWEYFTYRLDDVNCGASCSNRFVRLVGIADMNNGAQHPPASALSPAGLFATLEFYVANDQSLGDQWVPVQFYWFDCGDNAFSDPTGYNLMVDLRIFENDVLRWDEDDDALYPEAARPMGLGAPDDCFVPVPGKPTPTRCVEFYNAGIHICHPDSLDDRGDVNLNNVPNEISDVVLFSNYFVYGLSVFTVNIAGQIAATDVNADGLTLTVADLVYLIRVLVGDENPFPRLAPRGQDVILSALREEGRVTISSEAPGEIGGALLVYQVPRGAQVSNVAAIGAAAGMDVKWNVMDGQLRILLFKIGKAAIPAGPQELVSVALEGSGELLLARAEVVDYQGQAYSVAATGGVLPSEFVLDQNFPNPFNPSTVISFALANTADWTLAIYNVNGALVREYHGSDAGRVQVEWDGRAADGSRVASGVYLYRLEAGEFNDTKKMILLK